MENETIPSHISLLFKEEIDYNVAHGYYSSDEKAKKLRKSAVLLIEELWREICKSEGRHDTAIPYFAMSLYDKLNLVDSKLDLSDKLLVLCCLTNALKVYRGKTFALSEFLMDYECLYDIGQIKNMQSEIFCALELDVEKMKIRTPICFTEYFIEKLLQPSQSHHMKRTHRLVCELIVKSQADIAMTAFKQSIVAASAVLAISSKLFLPETFTKLQEIMFNDKFMKDEMNDVEECLAKITSWCDGLACKLVETVKSEPMDIPMSKSNTHPPVVNKPDDATMFMLGESSEKSTDTDDGMSEEASEKSTDIHDDFIPDGKMSDIEDETSSCPKDKKNTIIHENDELKNDDADITMTMNMNLCWTEVLGERNEPPANRGFFTYLLKATVSCLGVNEKE